MNKGLIAVTKGFDLFEIREGEFLGRGYLRIATQFIPEISNASFELFVRDIHWIKVSRLGEASFLLKASPFHIEARGSTPPPERYCPGSRQQEGHPRPQTREGQDCLTVWPRNHERGRGIRFFSDSGQGEGRPIPP